MYRRGVRAVVAIVLVIGVALSGCLQPTSVTCEGGVVCPAGQLCSSLGCMTQAQKTACNGIADGDACTTPTNMAGECVDGFCIETGCGNGRIEPGEMCDDGNSLGGDGCSARCDSDETCGNAFLDTAKSEGCDCGSADFTGTRPPGCNGMPNSDAPNTVCTSTCQIRGCGDGVVGGLEDCDGASLPITACNQVGFYTGTLACLPTCRYDVSGCSGRCGDNVRNGAPGDPLELCDGTDLGGSDCTKFGYYSPSGLACNALCGFDTQNCAGFCGDTQVNGSEQCDGSVPSGTDCTDFGFYTAGGLACNSACALDTSGCSQRCGDGAINGTEQCDGSIPAGTDCTDFGFYTTAGLACSGGCTFDTSGCSQRCGDNTINGSETCDGAVPAGMDCTDFGFYNTAGLACGTNCAFDTSGCTQRCGDGVVNNAAEQCDTTLPSGMDCTDFGFYQPNGLACSAGCTFDTGGCSQRCGDGMKNGTEACDGSVPSGTDCTDFGYYQANGLACGTNCAFDTSACMLRCGDGMKNGNEQCDTTIPSGTDCKSFGYYQAAGLTCSGGCTFDVSGCSQRCGDNIVNGSEACDGSVPAGTDCTDFGFYSAPGLVCSGACGFSTSLCRDFCGDDLVNGTEQCDGAPSSALGCAFSGDGDAGQLDCSSGCTNAFQHCRSIGFELTYPGATSTRFFDAWNRGSESFAVGDFGRIVHNSGGAWSLMASLGPTLRGVWGASATEVFAVGDAYLGTYGIFHYDGATWSRMTSPSTSLTLFDVAGSNPTNVWAVGDGGVVLRYTGTWAVQTTTIPSDVILSGVVVNGSTVWVTGLDGGLNGRIFKFDGTSWSSVVTAASEPLVGVYGASASDIYAVSPSTVWHYNGTSWSSSPGCTGTNQVGVGGLAGGAVVVAGVAGAKARICQLAGGVWTPVELPSAPPLENVGVGDTRLIVVGDDVLFESTGASWLPRTTFTMPIVQGVWGTAPNNVYAVGPAAAGTEYVYRYDGSAWTLQTTPGGAFALNDVAGGTGWAVAVGSGGRVLASNGTGGAWTSQASNTTNALNDVWGDTAGTAVYAVGAAGTITRRTSGTWAVQVSGTRADLAAVWGSGTTVFAVGAGGVIVRKVGAGAFASMTSPTNQDLRGV